MKIDEAASYAEIVTSPGFVAAKNEAWENDPVNHEEIQEAAQEVIVQAITGHEENVSPFWEARRLTAINGIKNNTLHNGPFTDYFIALRGTAKATELTKQDLDLGESGPVQTNSAIMNLNQKDIPAIEFLDSALDIIKDRNASYMHAIGPENYATSIKFFTDKVTEQDTEFDEVTLKSLKESLEKWAEGFSYIAKKDAPNFVEMTNIYKSVCRLPRDAFPPSFTSTLIRHSLEALPSYHREVHIWLLSAISRMNREQNPLEMSMLTELSINSINQLITTTEYRIALRAIKNLQPSQATNNALRSLFDNAHDLQDPMDLDGLEDTAETLRTIVDRSIDEPGLTVESKQIVKGCASRAVQLYKQISTNDQAITPEELHRKKRQIDRIINHWQSI